MIEDLNDISIYSFNIKTKSGKSLKGVVKVEFEEVG